MMDLIVGEKIVAKTNAEFLNLLFGTNYKQYMRSILLKKSYQRIQS